MCIWLTVTYEKVTLTRKKNTMKILAKLYESATSHSRSKEFDCVSLATDCSRMAFYGVNPIYGDSCDVIHSTS